MRERQSRRRKIILALFLSGLSGFIDILGLFGIGGMFLSFMSGNSTRLAFYLAEGEFKHALPYLLLIFGFVFGAFAGDLIKSRWHTHQLLIILMIETILVLTSFFMLSYNLTDEWSYLPLTVAMGIQNAIQIVVDHKIIARTFFSGVLHSLGVSISQALQKNRPWRSAAIDLAIWLVAVSGAFLAGWLQPNIPVTILLLGVSIILLFLIFVIIIFNRREKGDFISLRQG